ncbi:helix-turn-helix domain-containing protein [Lactococcus garvieae]|uniref:helix-turn-helix domain-containing protein n=1 Tax=Lactococcus garvieae TaxID=1363 RepID=UPI0037C8C11B
MAQNRIKELRKTKNMTLIELRDRVNDIFKEAQTEINGKLLQVSDSQLSFYENGKRSPRNEEVWEALSVVFNTDSLYLRGLTEIPLPKLEVNSGLNDIKEGLASIKEIYANKSEEDIKDFQAIEDAYFLRGKGIVATAIGEDNLKKVQENYELSNSIDNSFRGLMLAMFYLGFHNTLTPDFQIMLAFIQLRKDNQAKALEQVKNLLIVQETNKNHNED